MEGSQKPVVAFLGPQASYTHQASLDAFDEILFDLVPHITIEDVFSSVQTGTAHRGVVPFENSSNGSVLFTLDLFADIAHRHPDIIVCGEVYVDVHHCLIGHVKPKAVASAPVSGFPGDSGASPISSGRATPTAAHPSPGIPRTAPITSIAHVKKLYSHPQAWGQCKTFLAAYLKGAERQDVSSTSKAAELVALDPSGETAAISSAIAAKVHGLDFLAKDIEDRSDNSTRFFIIKKRDAPRDAAPPNPVDGPSEPSSTSTASATTFESQAEMARYKTLISFTVEENNPGALADSLAVFKPYKLNLTSINSRPSGATPWNYIFFIEIRGGRLDGDRGAVNAALKDLEKVSRTCRWIGSWENKQLDRSMQPILEDT